MRDISSLTATLADLSLKNREEEALYRKKKFKIESEVDNWIAKYDQEMEEKQAEIDDISVCQVLFPYLRNVTKISVCNTGHL